ncbi:hypothetical protein [Hymenobacter koreensis]|uniref:DUF1983 domain-containing protein n=1 Tax=Hymenobacter koreensis TaxID=1084523 RepID=A0ABP8JJP3_9BACT
MGRVFSLIDPALRIAFTGTPGTPQTVTQGYYYYNSAGEYLRVGATGPATTLGGVGWQLVLENAAALRQTIGQPNGLVPLGPDKFIPTSYIAGSTKDVLPFPTLDDFPATGQADTIYIATETEGNPQYFWFGSGYAKLSDSGLSVAEVAGITNSLKALSAANPVVSQEQLDDLVDELVASITASRNRLNHTGEQGIDTITGLQEKLDELATQQGGGISQGTLDTALTANSQADRNRTNHTGTQPISSVDGLQAALDGALPVAYVLSATNVLRGRYTSLALALAAGTTVDTDVIVVAGWQGNAAVSKSVTIIGGVYANIDCGVFPNNAAAGTTITLRGIEWRGRLVFIRPGGAGAQSTYRLEDSVAVGSAHAEVFSLGTGNGLVTTLALVNCQQRSTRAYASSVGVAQGGGLLRFQERTGEGQVTQVNVIDCTWTTTDNALISGYCDGTTRIYLKGKTTLRPGGGRPVAELGSHLTQQLYTGSALAAIVVDERDVRGGEGQPLVFADDAEFTSDATGPVLTSPSGTRYRLTVTDGGEPAFTAL